MTESTIVPTICDACGAERELVRSRQRTAARCTACGAEEDVTLVCTARAKWSVVGPDGVVHTFATRTQLLDFVGGPQAEPRKAAASPTETAALTAATAATAPAAKADTAAPTAGAATAPTPDAAPAPTADATAAPTQDAAPASTQDAAPASTQDAAPASTQDAAAGVTAHATAAPTADATPAPAADAANAPAADAANAPAADAANAPAAGAANAPTADAANAPAAGAANAPTAGAATAPKEATRDSADASKAAAPAPPESAEAEAPPSASKPASPVSARVNAAPVAEPGSPQLAHKPADSGSELELSVRDLTVVNLPPLPANAIPAPSSEPSLASPQAATTAESLAHAELAARAAQKPTDSGSELELSARDLTVLHLPPLPLPSPLPGATTSPPPPPPKGGTLATLPPPNRHDAPPPPPPSIEVSDLGEGGEGDAIRLVASATEPGAKRGSATAARSTEATPSPEHDAKRGWVLPAAAVALVGLSIAYAVRGAPADGPRLPSAAPSIKAALGPAPSAAAGASGDAAASTASGDADAAVLADGDKTAADAGPKDAGPKDAGPKDAGPKDAGTGDDKKLTLPELLAKASAARRSGDLSRARALLDRALVVSPGNVEAFAGLGDLSRAGGDLAGAKANYDRALGTSPSYSPALLGLADTLWDQGDRAGAQRYYKALVAQSSSPPDRARTRAASGPTGSTTTAPAPAVRPLTSADLPGAPR